MIASAAAEPNVGALISRIRLHLKGVYKGSIVGVYGIGALIIRIGFGALFYYKIGLVIK